MRRILAVLSVLAALVPLAPLALLGAAPAAADSLRDREYWLKEYGIEKAWAVSKGAGVKVAVIDSGVDGTHPDLRGVVVGGHDASGAGNPDGQKPIGSRTEHGTLVASMLAGRGHETVQEVDGVDLPLDDRVEARAALAARSTGRGRTALTPHDEGDTHA